MRATPTSGSQLALAEALFELGDAAAGVENLLLAGVERVAVAAHFSVDRAALGSGTCHEVVPA